LPHFVRGAVHDHGVTVFLHRSLRPSPASFTETQATVARCARRSTMRALRGAHHGVPKVSRYAFSVTGRRRGGDIGRAGQPKGITAMGSTSSGRPMIDPNWSPNTSGSVVNDDPRPRAVAASNRFWIAGNHDKDRGAGDTASRPGLDIGEQRGRQPPHRVSAATAVPGLAGEPADSGSLAGISDHDEDPRLAVLGARGERGRVEHALDDVVLDRFVTKLPAGALPVHHREDVFHGPHATTGPATARSWPPSP
jgi:hypothetical protein